MTVAKDARNDRRNRNAGLNLWATIHHLERAVLWSNHRIDRKLQGTLDKLRDLALQLQDTKKAEKAYSEKPIVRAEKLLREMGATIERPVVMPPD